MASCRRAGRKREEEGGRGKKMKKIREKSVELPRLFYSPFYSSSGWLLAGSTLGTRRFSLSAGICEKLSVSLSLSLSLSDRPKYKLLKLPLVFAATQDLWGAAGVLGNTPWKNLFFIEKFRCCTRFRRRDRIDWMMILSARFHAQIVR